MLNSILSSHGQVLSGREAMFLLLQSARVYDDIKLYLKNRQTRNYNPLKLVVRKWEDIDPGVWQDSRPLYIYRFVLLFQFI
jgi:hypothetical protein